MTVIGLCGGSGSGKGTVASMLSDAGFLHIDADAVYHGLTSGDSPCLREISDTFGASVISADGALDRRALASIVFADDAGDKLALLNSISHRYVLREIRKKIAENENACPAVIVDAPLLFESRFNVECDLIVSVIAPRDIRIKRITERDGLTVSEAERRIDSQLDDEFLIAHSDIIINNFGDVSELADQVENVIKKIKNTIQI